MDALIAAAIHDAKNNLTALGTWLAKAGAEHPSAAIDEARRLAERTGRQLVELLALYRAAEGNLRLAVDDHDLTDFCADVLAELAMPADSAVRIDAQTAGAADIGAWAFDAYQVKLVLLDALRNAVRHARTTVRFALQHDANGIGFIVTDDGDGFPPPVLAGEDGSMNAGSSGLGLRFARLIAERHATPNGRHGRIELRNPPQGGAEFYLTLP